MIDFDNVLLVILNYGNFLKFLLFYTNLFQNIFGIFNLNLRIFLLKLNEKCLIYLFKKNATSSLETIALLKLHVCTPKNFQQMNFATNLITQSKSKTQITRSVHFKFNCITVK